MKPAAQSFLRYPLNLIFDSPANVRVLRALAQHGGMLSASTLVSISGMTKPSVLSAARQLIEAGTVEALGSGRQRLYRFDDASPLGVALGSLFAAENQAYRDIIEAVRTSAEHAGAEAAWVYGSVARGEDRPGSDIDVAIACPSERNFEITTAMRDRLSDAWRHLGLNASVIGIDAERIERMEREGDSWWLAVKRDAIGAMGPTPEAYADRSRRRWRKAL